MREILFRAKRIDNGEWVEGFYHTDETGYYPATYITTVGYLEVHEVDPATVGQYINRTDDKKQKIFEGDRVLVTYGKHYNEPKGLTRLGTIIYDKKDCAYAVAIDNSAVKVKFWDISRLEIIHDKE